MRARTLARTTAAAAATAVVGSAAAGPGSTWYRKLAKPSWQPPPAAFPVVWTALYADLAVTSAVALEALADRGRADGGRTGDGDHAPAAYRRALAVNLVLNAVWPWLFFRARRPWLAAAECLVLTASTSDLVRRTGRADRAAGRALAPYAAWCAFATALSTAIARRN
ncbi:tryptophan-rich sensory protein [Georgenia sp. TF02-10]|uniref:TspO/MBR family protein n=1 Tax=Georgenia sp. TF02-10 TaxID=2917725 RepID=UPI001FA7F73D|nr:TspO/MBR family protein [Georgenia sp. TF02-10]UNX54660.1 tryptophan-rich sensory protein [Georgenia sp. TF02-10]